MRRELTYVLFCVMVLALWSEARLDAARQELANVELRIDGDSACRLAPHDIRVRKYIVTDGRADYYMDDTLVCPKESK